jgi:hypothetical protein
MNRRIFLKLAAAVGLSSSIRDYAESTSSVLEPWQPGMLDIHHMAYGRGNSAFAICPDGTTLLIDAGTIKDALDVSCAQKPNANVRPGQWIASYISRHMRAAGRDEIDYALITHLHPDHLGDVGPENPPSPRGNYRLTGIMDVDARVPVRTLIDRGFPDYNSPPPPQEPYSQNYLNYIRSRQNLGETTERLHVGSAKQIRLVRRPSFFPHFAVRNLAANGEVWTGPGDRTRRCFPALKDLRIPDYPTENMCSIAIRLSYGKFSYFTGGDLTSDTDILGKPWSDIETPVAQAAGPVEVAVADHHAYYDAVGYGFVRALRPQVFIVPAWYVAHPDTGSLSRMLSPQLYKGNRDIYATCMMDANRSVNNQFTSKVKSFEGHIIVRVSPGGEEFQIVVTDNSDDSDRIKLVSGPYRCN